MNNYHTDNVFKKQITNEESVFLQKLQTELNTQDNQCNRDPRFWVILGTEKNIQCK